MKIIPTLLLLLFCLNFVYAIGIKESDEKDWLPLTVWIPDQIEDMPATAKNNLENKLLQIVTAQGISGGSFNQRFIITANVSVLTKDLTATAPPKQAYTLDVTMYIGDGIDGKAFSSYSTTVRGVGNNETRAYMTAIRNIRTNDPNYKTFVNQGKQKIIDYYNAQCDKIIVKAQSLADMNEFDEAIWMLTSIPDAATDCWEKSIPVLSVIFQQKIDFECKAKLIAATNIWNANQSWDGAEEAGAILATIDPNSACLDEAMALADKIAKRILEVDEREWNFIYDREIRLVSEMIQAWRDVGVAWGQGQPQTIIYKSLW